MTKDAPIMATESAPVIRNYWQLPTFVVGVAAAIAAFTAFPPPPTDPAVQFRDDLSALRQLVDRRPPDVAGLESLSRQVAQFADQNPASADQAHFLAASGWVVLAEYGPASEAEKCWTDAVQTFAKLDSAKLTEPLDGKRFTYRNAKALAATQQGDPKLLFPALTNPPVGDDDAGERSRLLADVCLRLDPPDLKRAKSELTSYLGSPARLAPASLAKLKLQLAQIHTGLHEPDKARTWLKEIGPAASPEVQASAKVQLAKLAANENNWSEAVKLYEAAQATPGISLEDRDVIRYLTGIGQMRLNNPTAAIPYFEQAAKDTGTASAAASVRLAELMLRDVSARGSRNAAVDLLERSVRGVGSPSEFANPYVSIPEIQGIFEEAIQICLNEADYATAVRAATIYTKVSAPGRDRERRAEVQSAWAAALQVGGGAKATEAAVKFKAAAEDYAAVAETYPTPTGKADLMRRAADCLKRAGDLPGAVKAIDQVTTATGLPADATAAAWLDKGELLLAGHQFPEAEAALQRAIATSGPVASVARVKLALVYVEQARTKMRAAATPDDQTNARKQLEFGQDLLAQVANKTTDIPAERDAQQQALFELGKLLLQQQNFADAEARFRQLIQLNPTGSLVDQARLYLGSCLLLIARGDHQGGRAPADADRKLADARKLFEQLAESADPFLQAQADIRLANTTLLMKKYDDMPTLCEKLTLKYRGKVEELIVLSMLYSSQRYADRNADAARTLVRMEEVFSRLAATDFPGGAEEYTRDYWKKQWFDVLKPAGS